MTYEKTMIGTIAVLLLLSGCESKPAKPVRPYIEAFAKPLGEESPAYTCEYESMSSRFNSCTVVIGGFPTKVTCVCWEGCRCTQER